MINKILQVVSVIALVLILMVVAIMYEETVNENKQINKICSTKELSSISEIVYQLGDYSEDSELIKEIEETSEWKFERVYFDDRQREIIFSKGIKNKILTFQLGGTSPYLSNYYDQDYIRVHIYSKDFTNKNKDGTFDIVDNENLIYSSYKHNKDEDFSINVNENFDVRPQYSNLANEELEDFIDIYIKSVNTTYC